MINLQDAARSIVILAQRARLHRQCGLRNRAVLLRLLSTSAAGLSQRQASTAAGISDAALRLWLEQGKRDAEAGTDSAHAALYRIVQALRDARNPKPAPAPAPPPAAVVQPRPVPVAAPTPPPKPRPSAEMITNWSQGLARVEVWRNAGLATNARTLTDAIHAEMARHDLSGIPAIRPRLCLPRDLPWAQIATRYVQWCIATRGNGPNDADVEQNAQRWYEQQLAPEPEACAQA